MRLYKKAQEEESPAGKLVPILASIVVLIFLLVLVWQLSPKIKGIGEEEACRLSVVTQAKTRIVGTSLFSIDCPRNFIKFYNDKVEKNEKTIEVTVDKNTVNKFDELTAGIVNQQVAEELRSCWYKFLEGKQDVFNEETWTVFDKKICFICSEITFDSEVKQTYPGFYDYLKTASMPKTSMTYYDYIAASKRICRSQYTEEGKLCWEAYLEAPEDDHGKLQRDIIFDPSNKYAIFLVKEYDAEILPKLPSGAFKATDEETYFSYVIPAEELAGQCGYYVV